MTLPALGLRGWLIVGGVLLVLILGLQFGGTVKSWWVKRGIEQTIGQDQAARRELEAVRSENGRLKVERAELERRLGQLRREADQHRAEARRLLARAEQLERDRREQPRIGTLQEARDAFKALGY